MFLIFSSEVFDKKGRDYFLNNQPAVVNSALPAFWLANTVFLRRQSNASAFSNLTKVVES
jgi:hypothetical protein